MNRSLGKKLLVAVGVLVASQASVRAGECVLCGPAPCAPAPMVTKKVMVTEYKPQPYETTRTVYKTEYKEEKFTAYKCENVTEEKIRKVTVNKIVPVTKDQEVT